MKFNKLLLNIKSVLGGVSIGKADSEANIAKTALLDGADSKLSTILADPVDFGYKDKFVSANYFTAVEIDNLGAIFDPSKYMTFVELDSTAIGYETPDPDMLRYTSTPAEVLTLLDEYSKLELDTLLGNMPPPTVSAGYGVGMLINSLDSEIDMNLLGYRLCDGSVVDCTDPKYHKFLEVITRTSPTSVSGSIVTLPDSTGRYHKTTQSFRQVDQQIIDIPEGSFYFGRVTSSVGDWSYTNGSSPPVDDTPGYGGQYYATHTMTHIDTKNDDELRPLSFNGGFWYIRVE